MTDQTMMNIPLGQLIAHPRNSNVMSQAMLVKLTRHIEASGQYPPIIVRRLEDEDGQARYQILDGHHRVAALGRLSAQTARCVVWQADDQQALMLLATLNRLQGADDPRKRARLVGELVSRLDLASLGKQLPETAEKLKKMLALNQSIPPLRPPVSTDQMPEAVHFFLLADQRKRLESRLRAIGGAREAALMQLVDG